MTQERPVAKPEGEGYEPHQGASNPTQDMPQQAVEVETRPAATDSSHSLLANEESGRYRARWDAIQASFVDEPRTAVSQAQELLEEVFDNVREAFVRQKSELESQWDRGGDVSTENLRQTIQRYRTIFQRLLSA